MIDWRAKIEWLLGQLWFRAAFALLCVAMHVLATRDMARERFGQPFNRAPHGAPVFHDPAHERHIENGKRLAVARWDAEHYIAIAVRGYDECPPAPMSDASIRRHDGTCTLTFVPGYSMLGRALVRFHRMPMDYALWYITLLATFLTFFLWTGPTMTERFGVPTAWISLIVLNAFPTSCYLVFIGTEACTVFFTFASYLALARKQYLVGATLAGAASAMRISGAATSLAFALAVAWETLVHPPRGFVDWSERVLSLPVAGWGVLATMGFFWWRFEDPLIYERAHEIIYHHHPSLAHLLDPKPDWIMHSIDSPAHDAVWVVGIVLWFMVGYRIAFKRLPAAEHIFMWALVIVTLGISVYGSLELHLLGLSRYVLVAFPLFLTVGAFLRTRPVVLLFWLAMCRWHYRESDLCYYVGDVGTYALRKCNMTQWVDY